METENVVSIKGLGKSFKEKQILKDICLDIQKAENVVVLGKSGSGKSTLINMITGIDRPTAGAVTVDGMRLDTMSEEQLAVWRGRNVGIVLRRDSVDVVRGGDEFRRDLMLLASRRQQNL